MSDEKKVYTAIGLMSGTSLDGVDAVLLKTDGHSYVEPLDFVSVPYDQTLRERIKGCFGLQDKGDAVAKEVERDLTLCHVDAVFELVEKAETTIEEVEVIGFHGQTVTHLPEQQFTWQLGDGALLAEKTGVSVVNDFRSADMAAGGQGAPLLPLYHLARANADELPRPVAILNIGGVSNVTWMGKAKYDMLAFDCGPGNALMDDYVSRETGQFFDEGGGIASTGRANQTIIEGWMKDRYFDRRAPKSLDRNEWDVSAVDNLVVQDGLATLSGFTVAAIKRAEKLFDSKPQQWLVAGGGRHNTFLMEQLRNTIGEPANPAEDDEGIPVRPVEDVGWNGDALEAEGFAYLAVRSALGLELSLPTTTGVKKAVSGGKHHKAR